MPIQIFIPGPQGPKGDQGETGSQGPIAAGTIHYDQEQELTVEQTLTALANLGVTIQDSQYGRGLRIKTSEDSSIHIPAFEIPNE